jgi:hypothetical protein
MSIKKNLITVLVPVDNFTDINLFLATLSNIAGQVLDSKITVEIVIITSNQIHKDVLAIYEDTEALINRYDGWNRTQFKVKYFLSDDNSFMKMRNYTDNEAKGKIGELVTFKSITPIIWYPNHLQSHWDEYKMNRKNLGWMLSRLEIKDVAKKDNEKENTVTYRLDDWVDHVDKIVLDELFIKAEVCLQTDFNIAAIQQKLPDGTNIATFHIGKLLTDEIIPLAASMELKGYNPKEVTIAQWIDMKQIEDRNKPPEEEHVQEKENEDGSVTFQEEVDDDGATTFTED